jgi:hypothetical protein
MNCTIGVEVDRGDMFMLIVIAVLMAIAAIGALVYLVRKVAFGGDLPVTSEWIEDVSLDRYRPMLHMLDGDDIKFLSSQPGFTPAMASRLRTQRKRIFRGYLKSLETDFSRICCAIKLIMVQCKNDRPELAETLFRQQITFACTMLSVRMRLALYSWGICSVDVTQLVKLFDSVRVELRMLVPATSMMVA